jgi:hypothetical protein
MWAASCDSDPHFVKPNAVGAVAMSATRPVSSNASHGRHMPESRAAGFIDGGIRE